MISFFVSEQVKRYMPILLILAIYLPAACLGHYLFRDESSRDFLVLLFLFILSYGISFPYFSRLYLSMARRALILASIVCLLVASVSSFTATLLSGGLFIYVVLSRLTGTPSNRSIAGQETAR
ncbi:hypothetical protein ACNFIC_13540 [Pseudomonas sp. NY15463]|uniref:hypothetical protein n=1 Tax=Pseudomonas sp. NY15463 TaxID=3400361 RepID=UPI003A880D55